MFNYKYYNKPYTHMYNTIFKVLIFMAIKIPLVDILEKRKMVHFVEFV